VLGDNGQVYVDGLEKGGPCRVTFPDLEAELWLPAGAEEGETWAEGLGTGKVHRFVIRDELEIELEELPEDEPVIRPPRVKEDDDWELVALPIEENDLPPSEEEEEEEEEEEDWDLLEIPIEETPIPGDEGDPERDDDDDDDEEDDDWSVVKIDMPED